MSAKKTSACRGTRYSTPRWNVPSRRILFTRGFTLIELLVVIAIIAIISGLAFPSLLGARRSAQSVHCLGQMRQIGIAAMMHADNNDDSFPRSQHSAFAHGELVWARALAPNLGGSTTEWNVLKKSIYRCSRDTRTDAISYGINVYFELGPEDDYPGYPQTWRRRSDIANPSATILFAENDSDADHIMPNFWSSPADAADCAHERHDGKANYIFADGHAESRAFNTIYDPANKIDTWHPEKAGGY
jgi:prepilin-type N-terminal cleavage/methylation domain-containing protein/prepilin-type processing-associated H-X9-DG protein